MPQIFVFGRTYHCQRCLNHGKEVARKGHKRFCEWATCSCVQCVLVEKRKMLNRQINTSRRQPTTTTLSNRSNPVCVFQGKSRNPKCARCGVHNRQAEPPPLKGHKKVCPYQHCNCYKCQLVTQRRSVMARQIHLRRSQKARQSNGSTATMAVEGDVANKMLPLGQTDVVGPLPMSVAPAVNNSYSMDMMMPTSPLMGHPTLPSMAEHSHPALVIPSRPTPTCKCRSAGCDVTEFLFIT
ncbi:DM domain containing protein [Trichuris trichiura]|uniref:DM domain containing protein n=1 Tax=Trichuris trichiura TaxID=36087 RepID=A0A077Z2F4_TRITR|nr:DM domain containing protein [Trichuris trichiura]